MDKTTQCLLFDANHAVHEITLQDISEHITNHRHFLWIDLREPQNSLLQELGEELGLHELSLEDALTTHQRPKLEEYGDYLFISSKTATLANTQVLLGGLHLFIGSNFIVIIRHGQGPSLEQANTRLARSHNGFKPGRASALYFILDEIVDHFQPVIQQIRERFLQLENLLLAGGLAHHDLEKLYLVKREMTTLRDAIDPLQTVLSDLLHVHPDIATKDLKVYFRDVLDHALRAVNTLDMLRASATDAMQFHMATLTLRQNEAVQKLAGWGAILAVPTVIFSLYGMNFKSMPELAWVWAYPAVLIGTAGGGFWLYRRLKKRGWI